MARRYAPVLCAIWDDAEFQTLTPEAQRMYIVLLSQKKMSMVGVTPYTPRVWAKACRTTSPVDVESAVFELEGARFVQIDYETVELLVRTVVKHDPPKGSKSIVAMWRAWQSITSLVLQQSVLREIPAEVWLTDPLSRPPEVDAVKDRLRNAPLGAPTDAPS